MRTPINSSKYEVDKKYRRMTQSILNLVESSMSGISSISMESLAGALPDESQQVSLENCPICLVSFKDGRYETKKTYGCKEMHTFHSYCLNKLRLSQSMYTGTLSCYVCKVSVDKPKKESVKKYEGLPVANPSYQDLHFKGTSQFHEYKSNSNVDIMNDCLVNLSLAVDFGCKDAVALLGDMELIAAKYYLKKVTENVKKNRKLDLTSIYMLSDMLKSASTHGNKEVARLLGESDFFIGMNYFLNAKQEAKGPESWFESAIKHFKNADRNGYANASSLIGESELSFGKILLEKGINEARAYLLEQAIHHFQIAKKHGIKEVNVLIGETELAIGKVQLAEGNSEAGTGMLIMALPHFKKAIEYGSRDVEALIGETEFAIGKRKLIEAEKESNSYIASVALSYFDKAKQNGIEEANDFIFKANMTLFKLSLVEGKSDFNPFHVDMALECFKAAIEKIGNDDVVIALKAESESELLINEAERLLKELTPAKAAF